MNVARLMALSALLMGLSPLTARAALRSATWGTDPKAPVYVGQVYDLTLTLVTEKDEEITGVNLDQGPNRVPDAQSAELRDGLRHTVLRWRQSEDRPKLTAIPKGHLIANVTTVRTFGFMRSATTDQQAVTVPAFSYEATDLPGEAKGAPVGAFTLTLSADAPTFRTGDVRVLTATLEAREGRVPETFAFALEGAFFGIESDHLVHKGQFFILKLLFYVLLYEFGVCANEIDVYHTDALPLKKLS